MAEEFNEEYVVKQWHNLAEYTKVQREAEQWLPREWQENWVRENRQMPIFQLPPYYVRQGWATKQAFLEIDIKDYVV